MIKKGLLALLVIAALWQVWTTPGTVTLGPGIMVRSDPVQQMYPTPIVHQFDGYTFTEMATFSLQGKVLLRADYSFDALSRYSPLNLTLGWKWMSDEAIIKHVRMKTVNRSVGWQAELSSPISPDEISANMATVYIVPENSAIKRQLSKVRTGEIIELSGSLINIKEEDGKSWQTSLSFPDRTIEILWVKQVKILTPE
uniref:hypothetical protein n=1 Tax=Thaumasiovibrio occultus TaxID=1891184 RepID=UPI000B34F0FE|nr:hypothetical protein [Thaumasiovibrio occultus]